MTKTCIKIKGKRRAGGVATIYSLSKISDKESNKCIIGFLNGLILRLKEIYCEKEGVLPNFNQCNKKHYLR